MSRRLSMPRCSACGLHVPLCMCAMVEPIATRTRVVVVMHRTESGRASNSGRLVPLALSRGEVRVRGLEGAPFDRSGLYGPDTRTRLLFPHPGAPVLEPDDDPRPLTLLVPDGNWRQVRRLLCREPALQQAPAVRLPPGPPSRYRLRSHPDPARIATFEAVARALGVLEGSEIQTRLEHLFAVFVERTLWSRGQIAADAVTGGVPGR